MQWQHKKQIMPRLTCGDNRHAKNTIKSTLSTEHVVTMADLTLLPRPRITARL